MSDENGLLDAVDQVPFILAVCAGPDLRVIGLSAATRGLLPGREWRGVPVRELLVDLAGQQFVDAYHEVYATGTPITGREWRAHLTQPDGSVLEMFANFTISPWHTADGAIGGVVGVGFDVTELVRERQAAAELQRRYDQSRDVILALQRELLPAGVPVLPGAQIAASYLVADADSAAGGDWFDAVPQPDGRVALVVGDVVGHGVAASGVMGQLRAVLEDRLLTGDGVVPALTAADRFAGRVPGAYAATVCLVSLDPATGELVYCTAGHPPPLVVPAGGPPRYLPGTGGTPLGTGGSFPVLRERLDAGDVVVLYSDGILERPGRTSREGAAEMAKVAADTAAGRAWQDPGATAAERVCTQVVELLVRTTGHTDDITLLAAQRVEVAPDLTIDLPAVPSALREARHALAAWLERLGATAQDVFLFQHAMGELLANAVEHGAAAEQPVELRARLGTDGWVTASVRDRGAWREPSRSPARGRGLALTAQLIASLRVTPGASGTLAVVRHPLTRPGRFMGVTGARAVTVAAAEATFAIVEVPDGSETSVRLVGALDSVTAAQAQQDLLRRSRGGTVAMSVDLSDLSYLSSAGVAALHQVAGQHESHGAALTLHATPGSPAQTILDLVALPYHKPAPTP